MTDNIKKHLEATECLISRSERAYFTKSEVADLRCLIRLTVEFHDYLQHADIERPDQFMLRYCCESIFSGIDSFCNVSAGHRILAGATIERVEWNRLSARKLKKLFMPTYRKFAREKDVVNKCGLLLALFRIQIVFAGMSYGEIQRMPGSKEPKRKGQRKRRREL